MRCRTPVAVKFPMAKDSQPRLRPGYGGNGRGLAAGHGVPGGIVGSRTVRLSSDRQVAALTRGLPPCVAADCATLRAGPDVLATRDRSKIVREAVRKILNGSLLSGNPKPTPRSIIQ